jgi:hypothetical protein
VIKVLAALFMLIDHIGMILFPQIYILRIIGRLSMPLFAYCIARGFYFSEQKGTTMKYARNIFLFAVVSQIPFTVLSIWVEGAFSLNIGVVWLLSICLMKAFVTEKRPLYLGVTCGLIFLIALAVPMNYGLYAVLYPSVFFLYMFRVNKPQYAFLGMAILYAFNVFMSGGQIQVFTLVAFPVLLIAKKHDDIIKPSRRFFYWFYPVHIAVLLAIKWTLMIF